MYNTLMDSWRKAPLINRSSKLASKRYNGLLILLNYRYSVQRVFREDMGIQLVLFFILSKVQASLSELHTKLEHPIKSCTSSSETYKALQNHMVFLSIDKKKIIQCYTTVLFSASLPDYR